MAVRNIFVDDIDGIEIGDEPESTVAFGYRGKSYAIDLHSDNRDRFDSLMAEFIESGREILPEAPARPASTRKTGTRKPATDGGVERENGRKIRAWFRSTGGEVAAQGRMPDHVQGGYDTALAAGDIPPEFMPGTVPAPEVVPTAKASADEDADDVNGDDEDVDSDDSDDGDNDDDADSATDDVDPFGEDDGPAPVQVPASPAPAPRKASKSRPARNAARATASV